MLLLIGIFGRQFTRAQVCIFQRKGDQIIAAIVGDAVSDGSRRRDLSDS